MTLVVAQKIGNRICIVSDLSISFELESLRRFPGDARTWRGTLKSIVVSPEICVSYAGTIDYALQAIRKVKDNLSNWTTDKILEFLLAEHLRRDKSSRPDFILATLNSNGSSLHRIADSIIQQNLSNCWLGSEPAFNTFQKSRHMYMSGIEDKNASDFQNLITHALNTDTQSNKKDFGTIQAIMSHAMDDVINSEEHDTVGGYTVRVRSDEIGFRYMGEARMIGGNRVKQLPSNGEWVTVQFGGIPEGAFHYSILTPDQPGVAAVAVHIFQIKFGILYYPLVQPVIALKGAPCTQFIEWVKENYNLELSGPIIG